MKLFHQIVESVLGCRHRKLSRVFTIKRRTYQVCYECGRKFEYSWALMRCVRPNRGEAAYAPLTDEHADIAA